MKKATIQKISAGVTAAVMTLCFGVSAFASGEPGSMGGPSAGMPGGSSGEPESYEAVYEYDSDASETGKTYDSTGADENAILVTDGTVEISGAAITRESDDSTGGGRRRRGSSNSCRRIAVIIVHILSYLI